MARTRLRQAQANRSLISFEDLGAFYKSYLVQGGTTVASTSVVTASIGRITLTGVDLTTLELESGDVIELFGTGGADGDYRIVAVVSPTQLNVSRLAMPVTTGGTADIFYKEGARYIGTNVNPWLIVNGFTVQEALNSVDTNLSTLFSSLPQASYDFILGGGSRLPYTLYNGLVQAAPALGKFRAFLPAGNSTIATSLGSGAPARTGTNTTRNVALTNVFTMQKRIGYVSSAASGSSAGIRFPVLRDARGDTSGGGFLFTARFGASDAAVVAQARTFVGMLNSTGVIGNVNPSTLLNCVGVGSDSGDVNLSIIHNDASGVATKIPLGVNFPANTLSQEVYLIYLYAPINQSYVEYYVEKEFTGTSSTGRITTNLPVGLLAIHLWRNNGATGLAVGLDIMGVQAQ